jgi:transglutaminase-like putative cysteine protease/predicted glutamine amidotransferase
LGDITSDILALSFDSLSSPSIKVKLPEQLYGSHPLGWGVAWYPNDNQAAIVKKDPVARGTELQMETLADWTNFRSTVFFCKAKGAASGYTHHETQPFSRSFAGQDWLFMHNGDLDKNRLAQLHKDKSRFLEPVGKTDSELAFCYLLGKVMETEARKLSDVPNEVLLGWFQQLDMLGSADMCISDGITLACFYGTQSTRRLFYSRTQPPEQVLQYGSETMSLGLTDPRDTYRTALIISSSRFDAGSWLQMQPGQLIIVKRGAIVWNSQPNSPQMALSLPTPAGKPQEQKTGNFVPQQAEQAQIHQSVVNLRSITQTPEGFSLSYRTFDITHVTNYSYTEPVEHSTHTFRLQPVEDPAQEVVTASFSITSNGEEIRYEDVFGNQSIHYSINIPYTQLSIQTRSRVKVYATPPDDHSLSQRRSSIPLVWMPWQRQMMTPYLLPTELPETQLRELTDYAMSFVERNDYRLMDTLRDINSSIYRDYKYMPGITSLNTTPFEVYVERAGVCQDFANLFICLTRLLSIPSRYRMGYIFTGANYENKIQSDASHAWVEIYIPYVGWRGFDPTNGIMVSQDHVRVACGRNYIDATPTSGTIFKGGGTETLSVDVKLKEIIV